MTVCLEFGNVGTCSVIENIFIMFAISLNRPQYSTMGIVMDLCVDIDDNHAMYNLSNNHTQ